MKTLNGWAVVADQVKTFHGIKKDYILSVCATRAEAREEKALHGGKADGIRIVKLTGNQEVR